MSETLYEACIRMLKPSDNLPSEKLYRNVRFGEQEFPGLHLVCESKDRIIVIGFCWEPEAIYQTRRDILLFANILPMAGVHKKLHLVLFYDDSLSIADQSWPSGISFSPIALPPGFRAESPAPSDVLFKLGRIMGTGDAQTAAGLLDRHDWLFFLSPKVVTELIREWAEGQADLPSDMEVHIHHLLDLAKRHPDDLEQQVHAYLDHLWEGRS